MRRVVAFMQTTLDGRIANNEGGLWEPFAWGDEEIQHINPMFAGADTWAMGRVVYNAIAPWWTAVARGQAPDRAAVITPAIVEFARIFARMTKLVFSTTLPDCDGRIVVRTDPGKELLRRKREGQDIILSCGPALLGSLASAPGLVDEYLMAVHPALLANGPRMFAGLRVPLRMTLRESRVFSGGCVLLRYAVTR